MRRIFAFLALAVAIALFLHWLGAQPTENPREFMP